MEEFKLNNFLIYASNHERIVPTAELVSIKAKHNLFTQNGDVTASFDE